MSRSRRSRNPGRNRERNRRGRAGRSPGRALARARPGTGAADPVTARRRLDGAAVGDEHVLRAGRGDHRAVHAPDRRGRRAAGRAGGAAGPADHPAEAGRDRRPHRPLRTKLVEPLGGFNKRAQGVRRAFLMVSFSRGSCGSGC